MSALPLSTSVAQESHPAKREHLLRYIELKLATLGLPTFGKTGSEDFLHLTLPLVRNTQEKSRLLSAYLAPVDRRIQDFLDHHLADVRESAPHAQLPHQTLVLDVAGIGRELSLPAGGNYYENPNLKSYRLMQGVLHNPTNDRRTTQGVFHVATGGLPVPPDKRAVPKVVFARLLAEALNPPKADLALPYLAGQPTPAETFVSLLLRPIVVPEVPGISPRKSMEIRFFAPGSLVCNLDFVETIFGNGGDPSLPENDAALDADHWTGHTGCIILAPHLTKLTKKAVGLPHYDDASPRQRADKMCWKKEDEIYNDGSAFKVTCRTAEGVMVTLIADNYFGYCKKEVKTQISYAANLLGNAEEEHAGGAIAFPRFSHGDSFVVDSSTTMDDVTVADLARAYPAMMELRPEGYATDLNEPSVVYVPNDAAIDLHTQKITWKVGEKDQQLHLDPTKVYIYPSGYRVVMERHPVATSWRLVGTAPEGTFCHKPCTVSGGGKSEISKSIRDFFLFGPIYVGNFEEDMKMVEALINKKYDGRFRVMRESNTSKPSRPILSRARTLGSVIKLLTPSVEDYSAEYNAWLASIPDHVKALVFIVKRFYRPEWGADWRKYFTTDMINGGRGHELKFAGRALTAKYLRVGLQGDGSWRTYKVRQDYISALKIQMEDDITASTVVPASLFSHLNPLQNYPSVKITENCEARLFQRPDEAIHRGSDRQTERELTEPGNFISNFAPLEPADARKLISQSIAFHEYTEPMRRFIESAAQAPDGTYFVASSHPRIVDGKPTKNPRYLQARPDLRAPLDSYLAEVCLRLRRRIPATEPVAYPVDAVLAGRRNNPAGDGVRSLAPYNPIHYQELPELFMDFICSLTGKSPSTTGAGSEGALTKGPFNAINATADLNNALVSYILTGYAGYTSAAGYVGPKYRVDHDISLLIPELWCRLAPKERDPQFLLAEGCLEKVNDFEYEGKTVPASRLGYRITGLFLQRFFGRVFDIPSAVFDEAMLKPETQDLAAFVDGVNNIAEAQQRVAEEYLNDGSVKAACPPIQALLHIMATGSWNGKTASDPEVRRMFTREYLLASDWYAERLRVKQQRDIALWTRHTKALESFLNRETHAGESTRLDLAGRLSRAKAELARVSSPQYLKELVGTIGADPIYRG